MHSSEVSPGFDKQHFLIQITTIQGTNVSLLESKIRILNNLRLDNCILKQDIFQHTET